MKDIITFDAIIIGGSYAGLSAAISLGRSLRNTLIIDAGEPCNRQTPYSHNFLTRDGYKPSEITTIAMQQLTQYQTLRFVKDKAVSASKASNVFNITTQNTGNFKARKLIFATGLKDEMPNIEGFAECWGISVIHCPYCHGYEVKHKKTGIIANGEAAFHYARLISNWTADLTVFTNGSSTLNAAQEAKLKSHNIPVVENPIKHIRHTGGQMESLVMEDGTAISLDAVYSRPDFKQHSELPEQLGCELTEQGLIKIDAFQKTSVSGVFACGDNANLARSVALSVASGSMAGAFVNHELIDEDF